MGAGAGAGAGVGVGVDVSVGAGADVSASAGAGVGVGLSHIATLTRVHTCVIFLYSSWPTWGIFTMCLTGHTLDTPQKLDMMFSVILMAYL